jgi:hypothetical protein
VVQVNRKVQSVVLLGLGRIRRREGKSGGFHSMVLFKEKGRAVLIHGFAKKDLGNVPPKS